MRIKIMAKRSSKAKVLSQAYVDGIFDHFDEVDFLFPHDLSINYHVKTLKGRRKKQPTFKDIFKLIEAEEEPSVITDGKTGSRALLQFLVNNPVPYVPERKANFYKKPKKTPETVYFSNEKMMPSFIDRIYIEKERATKDTTLYDVHLIREMLVGEWINGGRSLENTPTTMSAFMYSKAKDVGFVFDTMRRMDEEGATIIHAHANYYQRTKLLSRDMAIKTAGTLASMLGKKTTKNVAEEATRKFLKWSSMHPDSIEPFMDVKNENVRKLAGYSYHKSLLNYVRKKVNPFFTGSGKIKIAEKEGFLESISEEMEGYIFSRKFACTVLSMPTSYLFRKKYPKQEERKKTMYEKYCNR